MIWKKQQQKNSEINYLIWFDFIYTISGSKFYLSYHAQRTNMVHTSIRTGWSEHSLSAYRINGHCSIYVNEQWMLQLHGYACWSRPSLFAYDMMAFFHQCATYYKSFLIFSSEIKDDIWFMLSVLKTIWITMEILRTTIRLLIKILFHKANTITVCILNVHTPYWYQCVCRNWRIPIVRFQDIRHGLFL